MLAIHTSWRPQPVSSLLAQVLILEQPPDRAVSVDPGSRPAVLDIVDHQERVVPVAEIQHDLRLPRSTIAAWAIAPCVDGLIRCGNRNHVLTSLRKHGFRLYTCC